LSSIDHQRLADDGFLGLRHGFGQSWVEDKVT
jgi:hypothetical protein